jgi:hypothetical protein
MGAGLNYALWGVPFQAAKVTRLIVSEPCCCRPWLLASRLGELARDTIEADAADISTG